LSRKLQKENEQNRGLLLQREGQVAMLNGQRLNGRGVASFALFFPARGQRAGSSLLLLLLPLLRPRRAEGEICELDENLG